MYNVTLRRVRAAIVAVEKEHVVYVCTLIIQHAKRMRRLIMSSVACLAPYYSTSFHKRYDLVGGGFIQHKMCFDRIYNLCPKQFSF
jgi:hypothetical protein